MSRLSPGMMGTLSWAVLNVTTPLSTRGRLSPPWLHSGAMRASASYEKSDFCQEPREKKSRQKDWQLDFALKKPLKRSHKGTCLFTSMQIGILKRMVDLHLWAVKPLTHGQCTTEIEIRCGRPEKRPERNHHLHDSLRCRCRYLRDYFFSLSSKCNTFLLIIRKH